TTQSDASCRRRRAQRECGAAPAQLGIAALRDTGRHTYRAPAAGDRERAGGQLGEAVPGDAGEFEACLLALRGKASVEEVVSGAGGGSGGAGEVLGVCSGRVCE